MGMQTIKHSSRRNVYAGHRGYLSSMLSSNRAKLPQVTQTPQQQELQAEVTEAIEEIAVDTGTPPEVVPESIAVSGPTIGSVVARPFAEPVVPESIMEPVTEPAIELAPDTVAEPLELSIDLPREVDASRDTDPQVGLDAAPVTAEFDADDPPTEPLLAPPEPPAEEPDWDYAVR